MFQPMSPYQSKPNPFEMVSPVQDPGQLPMGGFSVDPSAGPQMKARKRGMFAGATIDLNAALAGFAAGMGNPAGAAALQNVQRSRQMAQQQQADEEEYQRRQADGWDRWVKEQQYKLANPEPANNDTVNDYNFVLQHRGKEAADQWLQNNVIDRPVVVQGPNGPVAYRPSQLGGAERPAIGSTMTDPRNPQPQGGAGSPAPLPFR